MKHKEKQQCVYCKKFFTLPRGHYTDACTGCTDDDYEDEEYS